MRILFVTNNYTPYAGGVVSSIQVTIAELQKKGHEVILVAPQFLREHADDPDWVRRVPSVFRFRYKKNHLAVPIRAQHFLKSIIEDWNPDVVHVHHPFFLGPMAVKLARKKGIKTIFTYHTVYEGYTHYVPLPQFVVDPVVKRLVLRFCKKVDRIIAPSSTIENYLHSLGIQHVVTIPSGIKKQFAEVSFEKKDLGKPYKLLFVGRFTKEKNIPALFELMTILPSEYQLTLVGFGAYTDYLKKEAYNRSLFKKDRILFCIKPSQAKLLELYKNAHLFVFPSHTDTQGLVLAEAMGSSIPVLALDGPGQRDIIHSMNGFIANDIQAMAKKIRHIVSNESRFHEMQKAAWLTSQNFHVAKLVAQLEQEYEMLVFAKSGQPQIQ